jgi:two-component system sensor histidine kinase SenX3
MNANLIQLLSLYKLGKSIYPVDIDQYSVSNLIEEVVLQNRSILDFKGITISVDCEANCYWYLDRDLVTGILINALNNAYNYTHDQILVSAKINAGYLELRVEDNGKGYPAYMLQDDNVAANKGISFFKRQHRLGLLFFIFGGKAA